MSIQQLKQVMSSSTVTYNEKELNDELRKLSRPLRSLITDHGSVQKLVTENPTLSQQAKSGRAASKRL